MGPQPVSDPGGEEGGEDQGPPVPDAPAHLEPAPLAQARAPRISVQRECDELLDELLLIAAVDRAAGPPKRFPRQHPRDQKVQALGLLDAARPVV